MNFVYEKKKITGVLTVLPKKEILFDDELENYNFSKAQSMKLKLAMGYNKHRIVENNTTVSDLAVYGLNYLFETSALDKESIDALILVTQSPDYFLPATSNIIQGRLGLKEDMLCIDINQGCSGYLIGLQQAFMFLEQETVSKVVVVNADTLSKKVSKRDRNSHPLTGDAAAITIVEKNTNQSKIHASIKMDGTSAKVLHIPAGGFQLPSNAETALMKEDGAGNFRSLDNLVMQGDKVFSFVQERVPPLIEEILEKTKLQKEDIDYYLFHQPNRFMLQKLADKLGVPREKMPNNIVENFGNASGVTIPTNISFNLGDKLLDNTYKVCLSGFGIGLTWGAMIMDLGMLEFNKIIEF
ncbi:MAG: ketoacyl-ACP synthase III [Bacteroidales bacterium]|nr:ketoacyl-ACP synthase III [Bacteroidales bacterium]